MLKAVMLIVLAVALDCSVQAAFRRKLPLTRYSFAVARKHCHLHDVFLDEDKRLIVFSGLLAVGQQRSAYEKMEACLRRQLAIPADVAWVVD